MLFEKLLKEQQYQLKLTLWSAMLFLVMTIPFVAQHKLEVLGLTGLLYMTAIIFQYKNISLHELIRFSMLGLGLFFVNKVFGTLRGLEPGVGFLAILSGIKLFEMKGKRDFFILCLILQLYLVGELLSEDSLAVVIYILLATIAIFFMIFCVSADTDSRGRNIFSLERLKVTIKIFIHSLPLMFILYFAFPRISIGHLFPFAINTNSVVGFTGEVNPGDVSKVAQTDDPVFRVKFKKRPHMSQLYFRGNVLNRNKGFSWKKNHIDNTHLYQFEDEIEHEYDVFFHDLHMSPLFTLERTREVERRSNGRLFEVSGNTWKMIPFNNQKIRFKGVTSKASVKPLTKRLREVYMELPEIIPDRILALAEEIKKKTKTQDEIVAELRVFILKNKFEYSLSPGKYDKEKGLEEFLFERKVGFCEHFAAAMGVLLRLTGIPTRLVVGFQGGEYNPVGDYYLVKTKDAHAWLEIYHEERGWQRLDPTSWVAPSRINLGASGFSLTNNLQTELSREQFMTNRSQNPWLRFKMTLDMMYYELNSRFLEFDYEAQKKLFKKMKFKVRKPIELIIFTTIALALVFSLYLFFFKKQELPLSRVDQEYEKFLEKLSKRGIERQNHMGPISLKNQLQKDMENYEEISHLLDEFSILKYGPEKREERIQNLIEKSKEI